MPSKPSRLDAENITDTSLIIRWILDNNSVNPVEYFNINMTLIGDLKHPDEAEYAIDGQYVTKSVTKRYKVDGDKRQFFIDQLKPFSLYNVTMESVNKLGKSLPSYTLRILTLSKTESKRLIENPEVLPGPPKVPELPDTKQCCRNKNVTHAR